jgi:hypothetical protein
VRIMPAVDRARFAAVEVAPVAGKGDQIRHELCRNNTAPLPSRLCLKYMSLTSKSLTFGCISKLKKEAPPSFDDEASSVIKLQRGTRS